MYANFKIALVLKPLVENGKVELLPLLPYLTVFVPIRKFKSVENHIYTASCSKGEMLKRLFISNPKLFYLDTIKTRNNM